MWPGFARLEVQGSGNGEITMTGLVGSLMMSSSIFEPVRFAGFAVPVQQARPWGGCPEPLLGSALGMEGPEAVSRLVHRAQTTGAYLDLARPSLFNNGSLLYVDLELALGVPH